MTYEEALKYITEVGNFGSNYGLERTYRLLELLDNPQKSLKLIHVAGTNGKGSTTVMITKILIEAGYKVGMYTSPFLEEFEERIQINNINIPKKKLADLVEEIKVVVDKVIEEGYSHPTEFEIITVLMLLYFNREKIDFGVIEVGLGGRLDSTNVIEPIISVITSISFDHTNLLGNTLAEISREKAGIIKNNTPIIVYPQEQEALEVIEEIATTKSAPLIVVRKNSVEILEINKGTKPFQKVKIDDNYIVNLPLLGEHQSLNLAVAIKVIEKLNGDYTNISKEIIEKSIENVIWKGRLEVLNEKPLVVIDGAHNIQGITQLKLNIEKYFDYKNIYLIIGILADKDVKEMTKTIVPIAKKVYAVTPHSIRAELAENLKDAIVGYNSNCEAIEDYEKAFTMAYNDATEEDLVVITGSLYMIGDMRKIIKNTLFTNIK